MDINLGRKFLKEKKFKKAEVIFKSLADKQTNSSRIFFFLGFTYFELNQIDKSIYFYKKSLKLDPKSSSVMLNLAHALQTIGKVLAAERLYLKLIKLDKFNIRSYYGLYTLNPNKLEEKYFSNIVEISNSKKIDFNKKSLAEFLLSKFAKKNKKYNLEKEHIKKHHIYSFKSNLHYNTQGLFYYQKVISNKYDKIKFKNENKENIFLKNFQPIFLIGLPRTGSTLIETIITSSEEYIYSFGECSIINMAKLEQISSDIYQKDFSIDNFKFSLDLEKFKFSIQDQYNNYFDLNKYKNFKFVDKSLENFFNIESILKVFPNAKFIHCKRNIVDNIIAIYQAMLPNLSWTHSIETILNYVDNYLKIINYFENKYPNQILNINLEDLTQDNVNETKKIFEFYNLKWSIKILNFYKREDLIIKTLSNTQLRKKISKYDYNKYEKYYKIIDSYVGSFKWLKIL